MVINDRNEDVEDKLIKVYEAAKALIEGNSRYAMDDDLRNYCIVCHGYDGKCDSDCDFKRLEDTVNSV